MFDLNVQIQFDSNLSSLFCVYPKEAETKDDLQVPYIVDVGRGCVREGENKR